ncbi:hypothetical protein C0214_10935 [Methylobacterium sp. DM1]|uniref:Uncharacterized protein n=1 Tax=Methylorubrum populi (strain ATCC BAA-705 / NCIMB 13946 / BJ001) TaxID=441620 RepID=B1ZJC1_METPB|nr:MULTISPECIES: hypothetical protein [Methylorubrum]ACB80026.1 hypothetical protein Mpop_1863 [Methylorubrum populi BJ001]AWI91640.1 hypothetical protein C0214_10935 [Methylobacterium sp. DM1]MBI1691950.1 hypothetical protein [Methylorubrum sp. DB1722]
MDFEGVATAQAFGREIRHARVACWAWQDRAEALERELATARAEAAAHDAGRRAQLRALRTALDAVAPLDPVMRRTGRLYDCGDAERVWEAVYGEAYDDVARREGIAPCRRPMTPGERAEAAEAEVLAEPVRGSRCLWWRRWHWRGQEYRTRAGAERARERAARDARAALS